jgi:hypothetical protein
MSTQTERDDLCLNLIITRSDYNWSDILVIDYTLSYHHQGALARTL